ncbi:MAG: hypothetical protein ACE5HV_04045 [Acidobacteriota bacterium]
MSSQNLLLIVVAVVVVLGVLIVVRRRSRPPSAETVDEQGAEAPKLASIALSERDPDAIYQWNSFHGDRLVARVVTPDVDEQAKQVHFAELTHSDLLLLPDECHFQRYKLEIHTVEDATKMDKMEPEKGRILSDVSAKILGYIEH